jgi:single-stranded DNA-binding protein
VTTRIEVNGRLIRNPELRVTPAGTHALRLEVDCGEPQGPLVLGLVITGSAAADLATQLRKGEQIRAAGSLRALPFGARQVGRLGVEVVANQIERERSVTG